MRLVSWNCQMGFAAKRDVVAALHADLLIVPESSERDILGDERAASAFWTGDNARKGLGVLSYGDFTLASVEPHDPDIRYVLPLRVSGPIALTLLAVWAMPGTDRRLRYIGQVHRAVERYADLLNGTAILMGDFNSNAVWDRMHGVYTHSSLVERLSARGIVSAYHLSTGEGHGRESRPTQHQYRKGVAYHIDYCFGSDDLLRDSVVTLGGAEWLRLSDHVPLIVDLAVPRSDARASSP